ncbi:MAG: YkgJ family cysteine cluster protein [Crocinitomicaceae bacterium]|nr:YkgJ family cysteine cluster protein [Crocinitomicaceae bacterium]
MNDVLRQRLENAKSNRKKNKHLINQICRRKDADQLFHEAHEDVFNRVDCLTCANCCKTTSPIFRDVDIDRIARHLGIRPSSLTDQYLHIDDDGDWVLNSSPCIFLDANNYCKIYDIRPKACREYPHTDRKNMPQIADLTYCNTLVCPAVAEIVDMIRTKTGLTGQSS